MKFQQGDLIHFIEKHHEHEWQYHQATAQALKDFDGDSVIQSFDQACVYDSHNPQSKECQFYLWLLEQNYLCRVCDQPKEWDITQALTASV